jgi:hypothetical protein
VPFLVFRQLWPMFPDPCFNVGLPPHSAHDQGNYRIGESFAVDDHVYALTGDLTTQHQPDFRRAHKVHTATVDTPRPALHPNGTSR